MQKNVSNRGSQYPRWQEPQSGQYGQDYRRNNYSDEYSHSGHSRQNSPDEYNEYEADDNDYSQASGYYAENNNGYDSFSSEHDSDYEDEREIGYGDDDRYEQNYGRSGRSQSSYHGDRYNQGYNGRGQSQNGNRHGISRSYQAYGRPRIQSGRNSSAFGNPSRPASPIQYSKGINNYDSSFDYSGAHGAGFRSGRHFSNENSANGNFQGRGQSRNGSRSNSGFSSRHGRHSSSRY